MTDKFYWVFLMVDLEVNLFSYLQINKDLVDSMLYSGNKNVFQIRNDFASLNFK